MANRHTIPGVVLNLCVNGLGVARALGRNGVPVIGISHGGSQPGVHSRYVREIWSHTGGEDALVDLLLDRASRFADRPVVFPTADRVVRALAARYDEVIRHYRLGLPSRDVVDRAMSKRGFAEYAAELDLPVPRTAFVDSAEDIQNVAATMTFPCVVKPEFQATADAQQTGLKVVVAHDAQDLVDSCRSFCKAGLRVVVQEWVPGADRNVHFCLQYYDSHGEPVVSFTGRKIRQWPPLAGSTASCEPAHSRQAVALTTRFFTHLDFRGLCSMEFKQEPRTGAMKLVEPTIGRTDWQSAIADINGVPIPYVAYCDLTGVRPPRLPGGRPRRRWVRWSADRASASVYRRRGELSLRGWLWSIRPPLSWATLAVDDSMPWLSSVVDRARRKARRVWARLAALSRGRRADGSGH